jgi:hypothetical protein
MTEIWHDWESRYRSADVPTDAFCTDGIVDMAAYQGTKPKLLFVLKEVNSPAPGKWDLRRRLREHWDPMARALAKWTAGILCGFRQSYHEVSKDRDLLHTSLCRVAVVNLKKVGGGATSDMNVINAFAYVAKDLLVRQIEEIRPDIVVAGGVFATLMWLLDLGVKPLSIRQGLPVRDNVRNLWVIPWRHPSRGDQARYYEQLGAVILRCPELSKQLGETRSPT